ncbi:MAG TPA: N-acetylmuramoyl-L-alanine amidase [Myxococcales bacterium]|nr:N-acetylmuramoyl-L-alanine amidase [Myxococcales bacterium]
MRALTALLAACLLALPALAAQSQGALVVVLDAGHGGKFPHDGAHGAHGLLEKNIVLAVAQKTKEMLEAQGATVLLTREGDDDISFAERVRIANDAGADLFLSIHCNSMETRADRQVTRGVETYFLSPDPTDAEAKMLAELENGGPETVPVPKANDAVSGILADLALGQARNDSAALAEIVQHYVIRGTWAQSRGVRQAPFLVLSGTKMPSALVEIGFISHPAESKLLAKPAYQERVATALTNAVREFADKVLSRRLVAQVAKNVATTEHAPAAVALPAASAEPPAAVNAVARPDGTR